MQLVLQILLTLVAIFLILLVLVQRGRGGGLAGALGGMGGSSAFGAKAGDVFTRITIGAAAVWIILCIVAAKLGPATAGSRLNLGTEGRETTSEGPELIPPAEGEKESTEKAGEGAAASGEGAPESAPSGEPASADGEEAPESAPGESPTEPKPE
jgi:preprotein translocase subunit SecG